MSTFNMPTFYMLVSIPGAGKDTYYENFLKNKNVEHISSDLIRAEVFGDVNDQSHNTEVFEIMKRRTIDSLKEGRDCCYNATNLSSKRRKNFLKNLAHIKCKTVCIIIATPIEICLKNNKKRERQVPEFVIESMVKKFEVPFYNEGWDFIRIYRPFEAETQRLDSILDELKRVPHENSHHSFTIGQHMIEAHDYFIDKYFKEINLDDIPAKSRLGWAVLYHDIAKGFCKVHFNMRGEETKEAHYYFHDKAGAYMFLAHMDSNSYTVYDHLYIALLIQHHMAFFSGEKFLSKIKNEYGSNFYYDLQILNECDKAAH